MLTPMVSYAQNAEDVVLRRVFAELQEGFYVDVGACVPVEDSVTCYFYELGWSGVNIEPDPRYYGELSATRTRDVNLNAAAGVGDGPVAFYPTGVRGQGTLDPRIAAERDDVPPVQVPLISLHRVFSHYSPPGGVDFLKVDVEGWEAEVLASTDWKDVRPRIVLVEAVDTDGQPTHEAWEPTLLAADYRFGLYDGLNRFYCRAEDVDRLLPRLSAPANVLDNWRLAREVRVQNSLDARLTDAVAAHASTRAGLEAEQASHAQTRGALAAEQAAHAQTRAAHAETRAALAAEQAAHAQTQAELAEMQASTSWRITAPVRDASRLARLMRSGSSG